MTIPRLFFAAMPNPSVVGAIHQLVREHELDSRLGNTLFAPTNWHQSLSERIFDPSDADCAALLAVADAVRAHACTLQFNRVNAQRNQGGKIHWRLQAYGLPKAFEALNDAVRSTLNNANQHVIATGVTPHITLSYNAPEMLDKIDIEPTINWTLDELLLVIGGGSPYHYDVIGRWPLLPEIDPPQVQLGMFSVPRFQE